MNLWNYLTGQRKSVDITSLVHPIDYPIGREKEKGWKKGVIASAGDFVEYWLDKAKPYLSIGEKPKVNNNPIGITKLTISSYSCEVLCEEKGDKWLLTTKEIGRRDLNGKYEKVEDMPIAPFLCSDREKGIHDISQKILHRT